MLPALGENILRGSDEADLVWLFSTTRLNRTTIFVNRPKEVFPHGGFQRRFMFDPAINRSLTDCVPSDLLIFFRGGMIVTINMCSRARVGDFCRVISYDG